MFVIAGVSGNTGKVVAETLLAQKKPVRVVVRDAAKGEPWKARGAEVAVADLDDVAALTRALKGATAAYLLLPPLWGSTQVRVDSAKRTKALVEAVDASGIGHVVFLSSVASHLSSGTGPILTTYDAEQAFAKTKAAITFVRPAYFMENLGSSLYALGQGAFPTFLKADQPIDMVATQDIGTTAAKALIDGGHGHTIIELSGPREYSPQDVAAALSKITGKTIAVQQGPEEAMIPALKGAGLNEEWAGLFKELTHGLNVKHIAFEGGAARHVKGTTSLDTVLAKLVG